MAMTDPIADFLTRIRDTNMAKHESLEVPALETKRDIAGVLKREGFVRDVEYIEGDKQSAIRIFLKFSKNGGRVITNLKRISKPSSHAHVKADEVPKVLNGLGITIISTSEDVTTDKEAYKKNIGSETIVYV